MCVEFLVVPSLNLQLILLILKCYGMVYLEKVIRLMDGRAPLTPALPNSLLSVFFSVSALL